MTELPIPFLRPNPPRLSEHVSALKEIEDSGIFSNRGPINNQFEADVVSSLFGGIGHVRTVCNATIGLILAIKAVVGRNEGRRRYALMPSFTFAATGHAAIWAGFEPLFCDIDQDTWLPCAKSEQALLDRFGDEIAVVVPYATFGAALDLRRYTDLRLPVVVDAAASLGTKIDSRSNFGTGCEFPVVFSMHVTKSFASSEGWLVYCTDHAIIESISAMSNFGFEEPRSASTAGLNAKLSEVAALIASLKLKGFGDVIYQRRRLFDIYQSKLRPFCAFQRETACIQAHQFAPILLPEDPSVDAEGLRAFLLGEGVGTGAYFRPHLNRQPYFSGFAADGHLSRTDAIAKRIVALPLYDDMSTDEVHFVCDCILSFLLKKARS